MEPKTNKVKKTKNENEYVQKYRYLTSPGSLLTQINDGDIFTEKDITSESESRL